MKHLNYEQQLAVTHINGPMLVLAGPGSGKTTVICHRVKHLLENDFAIDKKILVITFSKSATNEMQARFKKLTRNKYSAVTFNTFHAFFYKILKKYSNIGSYKIIYEDEKRKMILKVLSDEKIFVEDADEIDIIINSISIVKNELLDLEYFEPKCLSKDNFEKVFISYDNEKNNTRCIDFDDMLSKCYNLLTTNEDALNMCQSMFDYILIDEFQDINKAQYECIKMISNKHKNLFAVGDDDQSIYRFRGSNPEFLLNFKNDFTSSEQIILNTNYRSNNNIIKLSSAIIKENVKRFSKNITGVSDNNINPKYVKVPDNRSEARFIADKISELNYDNNINYDDIAVIFRTNLQARVIVESFMDRNIPFVLKDITNNIYDHYVTKDILSYLTLSVDIKDNEAFNRIVNKPNRFISKAILEKFISNLKEDESIIMKMKSSNSLLNWQSNNINSLYLYLKQINKKTPSDAIKYIRKTIGYEQYLDELCEKRKMNIRGLIEILDELNDIAVSFDTITDFLEHISLLKDKTIENIQKYNETPENRVTLSTMHSSKGLEYEAVFVCGLVEGVVPHELSKTISEIEEERRLFYVAVTRAKNYLFLSSYTIRYDKDIERTRFLKFLK